MNIKCDKQRLGSGGFTLLELMVAAAIILIGLVLFLRSMTSIHTVRNSAEEEAIIDARVASVMDELFRADAELLRNYEPPTYGDIGYEDLPAVTFTIEYEIGGDRLSPPIDNDIAIPNPLEVHVKSETVLKIEHDAEEYSKHTSRTAAVIYRTVPAEDEE